MSTLKLAWPNTLGSLELGRLHGDEGEVEPQRLADVRVGVPLAGPSKYGLLLVGGSVDGLELHLLHSRVGCGLAITQK